MNNPENEAEQMNEESGEASTTKETINQSENEQNDLKKQTSKENVQNRSATNDAEINEMECETKEPNEENPNNEKSNIKPENDKLDTSWNETEDELIKYRIIQKKPRPYVQKIKIKLTLEGKGLDQYANDKLEIIKELKRCKAYVHYEEAYINSYGNLVIITSNHEDDRKMRKEWPINAFRYGVKIRHLSDKKTLAVKGVPKYIEINQKLLDQLYEEEGVIQAVRTTIIDEYNQVAKSKTIRIDVKTDNDYEAILKTEYTLKT